MVDGGINYNSLKNPPQKNNFVSPDNKILTKELQSKRFRFFSNGFPLKNIFIPPQFHANIFGLDIGASSIKLVRIAHTKAGLELADFWVEEIPYVPEPEKNKEIIRDTLRKIVSNNNIKGKVVASLGGGSVNIQVVKIPFMPEDEILNALEWEAREGLSIDLETVSMDYIILGESERTGTRQLEALLITAPKTVVYELFNVISEAGLIPHAFEPPPLAVVEAFGQEELKNHGRVLGILELGAGFTNFSIIIDGIFRFSRNIPITCSNLTDDIAEYLAISKINAEGMKNNYGLSGFFQGTSAASDALRVTQAINFKLEKLVSNLDHTFKFYLHQLSNLSISGFDKIILSGGGALIKDMDKFLASRLNAPIVIANPFNNIAIDEKKFNTQFLKDNAPRFTLAIGLALRKDGF